VTAFRVYVLANSHNHGSTAEGTVCGY